MTSFLPPSQRPLKGRRSWCRLPETRPPERPRRSGRPAGRCGASPRRPGRVLPVDLERESAALRARQRGHGAPAARQPLGSRGADGGVPASRRAAAAHAARDASLICQSGLETSAFPPSALKSPRGRAQAPGRGGEPSHRRPARRAASAGEKGVDTLRNCPPDARAAGALFPGP
uniref:Uncharacterized protein n=1 Tax=Equus caballus TaxID=9796 RepID=A0A9L0RR98_HORSE